MKYWDVVLREVFLVPSAMLLEAKIPMPMTIDDLSKCSGLHPDEVSRQLQKIDALQAAPVEIDFPGVVALQKECQVAGRELVLLDVRGRVEFAAGHMTNSISMHEIDFQAWLPSVADACVIVIGRDQQHAWSAAMYLRDHNVQDARALCPLSGSRSIG